jgi:SAM-dependent methyltransferase
LSSFTAILDWGCGVGRLTRYLVGQGPAVTGMGSQPAHMQYCRTALPAAHFVAMGDTLASGQFDLVLGLSMLPHLSEAEQDSWLAELQRLTRPGALLLLSVQGLTHMALYRTPMVHKLEAHRTGWHDMAGHAGLDSPTPSGPDVLHAPDYILAHWGRYFDVLDIIEAMAGHQDVVVLRRRA